MPETRHDWNTIEVEALFNTAFNDLLWRAQNVHRQYFDANSVQTCTTFSIKTGRCPEDCGFCAQSAHFKTKIDISKLLPVEQVLEVAKHAKAQGVTRFCMAAAWRGPNKKDINQVIEMIKGVNELGMESCASLGLLNEEDAKKLSDAGLNFYNHNLESSPEFYKNIVKTHEYQDRLDTLKHVRDNNIKQCCGGIIGMGEKRSDRVGLLLQLANLPEHPPSVPLNIFAPIDGTPSIDENNFDTFEFIRTVAVARIMMPTSKVRLTAGRHLLSDEAHALCYLAGANSIHYGEKLLTIKNATPERDTQLFQKLDIKPETLAPCSNDTV